MTMRFPIKLKILALIFVILAPMLGISLYNIHRISELSKEDIRKHNQMIASDVADYFDTLIDRSFTLLNLLAKHPAVIGADTPACNRLFSSLLAAYPEYLNIQATDLRGLNYGSGIASPEIMRLNFSDTEWFVRAKLGRPVVGDLTVSKHFRVPTTMIAVPVVDGKGKQTGIVRVSLNLAGLREQVSSRWHLPGKSSIDIIDQKGNIILCSVHDEAPCQDNFNGTRFREYISHDQTVEDNSPDHMQAFLYSFSHLRSANWKSAVSVASDDAYRTASVFSLRSLAVLVATSSLAILFSLVFSRRLTRNVDQLSTGLREIERGDLSRKLEVAGHDELRELAEAFNTMVARRRFAEDELRRSEKFMTSVLEGIGEGVIVIDRGYRIVSANHGYCRQMNKTCEEIIGRHCYEVSHGSNVPCYEVPDGCDCTVRKCFESGEHHRSIHTHCDSDGAPRYIETNAYPLKDDDGCMTRVIETLIDITDMYVLEKKIEDIKERYRKLYDESPEMMVSLNGDCSIIICNQTFAKTLGYDIGQLLGRSFTDFLNPSARETCGVHFEALRRTGAFEGESVLRSRDGQEIFVRINAKAVTGTDGEFVMADAVIQDVSEKKKLEAQLIHSQKMEAIGQLAGGTAHDFNNILMAIMGFAGILQLKMGGTHPLSSHTNQILMAAERGANLTRSLLAFSRKQVIQTRPVDLRSIVTSVKKMLQRIIGEDIQLKCHLPEAPLVVNADTGQIEQVLVNLAANARDAMPSGGSLTIHTGVRTIDRTFVETHGYGVPGEYAVMSVVDTGEGIGEAALGKIYEPFYTTKEQGKGTGLGLSIVYGVIKQHNGYILVESSPGKGTEFLIYLPLLPADAASSTPEVGPRELPRGTERILLAEDDRLIRRSLSLALAEYGYTVIEAEDGEQAVELFAQHGDGIRLLISDVIMPKKNGRTAFHEMKAICPDLRVLYLSGYTANVLQDKAGAGEEALIQKPVRTDELLMKIREILDTP